MARHSSPRRRAVKRSKMQRWEALAERQGWISGPQQQGEPEVGTEWLRQLAAAEQVQHRGADFPAGEGERACG